jgi:hypothetical protein
MGALSLMAGITLFLGLRRAGLRVFQDQPWHLALVAGVVVSGLGRAPVGGNLNNLMPVYALLCLSPGLLGREWLAVSRRASASPFAQPLIAALIVLQFALGAYNPLRYLPTDDMRRSGDRLVERLRAIDGEVLVLMHPYYALRAGKAPSTQIIHLWYFYKSRGLPPPDDFVDRLRGGHYAAVISDESLFEVEPVFADLIHERYVVGEVLGPDLSPPTITGLPVRPQVIYVRRPGPQSGAPHGNHR